MMDKMWFGIKSTATIAVVVGCFIIVMPLAARVMGLMEKKEQLYNEQMIQLSSNVVSQRVEFNNKLLQAQIATLNTQITDLAKARDQEIVAVGEIVAELKQDFKEQIGHIYKDAQDNSKDYVETVIKKTLSDQSQIPWGWAMYSPNIEGAEKWTTGTYPLKLHTKIAIGENDDRSDAMVEAYMTSNIFEADRGKKFPIDISSVSWVEKPPQEKSFMFNPRLSIGMNIGSEVYPALEVSFFSYGETKGDMDWRFLGLGFGATGDHRYLSLAPVEYNIGKPLPMMENLFIAPYIGLDEESNTVWGAQIQLPF
jgi:hypothetical protein